MFYDTFFYSQLPKPQNVHVKHRQIKILLLSFNFLFQNRPDSVQHTTSTFICVFNDQKEQLLLCSTLRQCVYISSRTYLGFLPSCSLVENTLMGCLQRLGRCSYHKYRYSRGVLTRCLFPPPANKAPR